MKVLYVTNMYPYSSNMNYGIFVKEQIDYLKEKFGVIPEVYFINGKVTFGFLNYIKSIFLINFKIIFSKYDKVHINYGISGIFLLFNWWTPKHKLVVTYRGGDILKEGGKTIQVFLSKLLSHRIQNIIVVSAEMKDILKSTKANIELIPTGVNTDFFTPDINKKSNRPSFKIIFPSSPKRWVKNYSLFKQIILVLEKKNIKIIECHIENKNREEVKMLYQTSDCLLLTSYSEGSPNVVKEALSCNLPVISTNVGDVAKNLIDLPFCSVFKENEHAVALLEKIYMENPQNINLRDRIFELELDQFSICEKIVKIYNS